jgi:hypothetical protein
VYAHDALAIYAGSRAIVAMGRVEIRGPDQGAFVADLAEVPMTNTRLAETVKSLDAFDVIPG